MSKKALLVFSIISLVLFVIVVYITLSISSILPIPTAENTTEKVLTVKYVKEFYSVATYIGVEEYDYEFCVYNYLVSDSLALSKLSVGDTIYVRLYTKDDGVQVWGLRANGETIIYFRDSVKYVEENNTKLRSVGIAFSCLFGITTVLCFCGYGVLSKRASRK